MLAQARTGAAYFATAFILAALQLHPLGVVALPVPVAVCAAQGEFRRAAGLIALAGMGAGAGTGSVMAVLTYVLLACVGLLVGLGFRRQWTFGKCLAVATTATFLLVTASTLAQWDLLRQASRAWAAGQVQRWESAAVPDNAAVDALIEMMQWASTNWDHLVLGMLLGAVLLSMSAVVTLSARWLRRHGATALPAGSLKDARPPEWLVWVAILVAALWFAEQQWPHAGLRMFTWNTAVGLAWVYWLNGFGCLLFALAIFKTHPFVLLAVLFVLVTLNVHSILATFGLFDTWWDFRRKLEKLEEARRLREREEE